MEDTNKKGKGKTGRWEIISDVLILSGGGLFTAGAAMIYPAAGFIVAGSCCVLIGWLASKNGGES